MEEQIKAHMSSPRQTIGLPVLTGVDKDVKALTPKHEKETHGRSDDIDGNTHVDEVKGPSVAQRVKEEFEALVGAVIPKKDNN